MMHAGVHIVLQVLADRRQIASTTISPSPGHRNPRPEHSGRGFLWLCALIIRGAGVR